MEKEGLIRGVRYLEEQELEIGLLVTDHHTQIAKWVRENMPDTTHRFDMWHVAKGITISFHH
jgi:solute carrier family 8 (sodium/calcium exchanger)